MSTVVKNLSVCVLMRLVIIYYVSMTDFYSRDMN